MIESRDLLRQLEEQGVHLYAEGDRLRLNAPKGIITPALQATIAERKQELLSLLRESSGPSLDDPITQVSREQPQPLSISQERLWGLMQMAGDTPLYNMYLAFRLDGDLDREALHASLMSLIQRHEPLRTQFALVEGQPVQQVRPWEGWSLGYKDLSHNSLYGEYIQREAAYPFDPLKESLFRANLLRLSDERHVLVLVMHHLVSDGGSWDVFLRELAALYKSFHRGESQNLPDLPVQYVDFSAWQRDFVKSPRFAAQKEFWIKTLQGVQPLELPLDAARTHKLDFAGDRAELELSSALMDRVQAFSKAENVTIFMTLLAVFKAVLHRITGQPDLLIGTPVSGRAHIDFQNILGYFNNILPLRTSLSGEESFRDFLSRIRAMALAAYDHADVPLHCLTDHPELMQVPFTRAVFALQDSSGFSLTLEGLHVEPLPVYNNTANFDLFLTVQARVDGLRLVAEYHSSLFEPGTIRSLLVDYAAFLDAALADSGSPLAELLPSPRTVMKTQADGVPNQHYQAPRTPLEAHLVTLWEEVFVRRPIGIYDNFFDIGGHSLMALRLFARIEKEVGTSLPLSTLFGETTIAHLAQLIETDASGQTWDILVPIQPLGSKPAFFSIHGVEGGVLGYRDIALVLGEDQPVWGIQAKGLDGREAHDSTFEEMATRYIEVMRSRQPNGPYRIGGYCLGGVIAYEMARQLEKEGEQVSVLAVFEGSMPEPGDVRVPLLQRLRVIGKSLPAWLQDYSGMTPRQLLNRFRSTFHKVWSKIKHNPDVERRMRVEETLDRIDLESLPRLHIELTDAFMDAAVRYTPGEYNGKVILFRARNRGINEVLFGSLDETMGWSHLAKGGVQVHLVDGFHRNMHLAPYASSLASELRKCLDDDSRARVSSGV